MPHILRMRIIWSGEKNSICRFNVSCRKSSDCLLSHPPLSLLIQSMLPPNFISGSFISTRSTTETDGQPDSSLKYIYLIIINTEGVRIVGCNPFFLQLSNKAFCQAGSGTFLFFMKVVGKADRTFLLSSFVVPVCTEIKNIIL